MRFPDDHPIMHKVIEFPSPQGQCTRKLLYQLHLSLFSYCHTKYHNQNEETKHLLKLFGSDPTPFNLKYKFLFIIFLTWLASPHTCLKIFFRSLNISEYKLQSLHMFQKQKVGRYICCMIFLKMFYFRKLSLAK